MKRYTNKSRIKKIKVLKNNKDKVFFAEIIKEPLKNILKEVQPQAIKEIRELVIKSWGDFEEDYLRKRVLDVYLLCLLRDVKNNLIGITPIKKIKVFDRYVYSFGLSVVDPNYQGLGLLKKMSTILIRRLFCENLLKGRTKLEFVFITPNIRTMGTLAKVANFIYPNPYLFDEETRKIPEADSETLRTVKEFLKITKENCRKLEKEGCIMEGFYDTHPHLIVKEKREHSDKKLNSFAKTYLYNKPGREIVVRAILSIRSILKNES